MRVAQGGLRLAVAQQFADHFQRGPAADQQGGKGVAQVVDAHVLQPALLLDPYPEAPHLLHWLAGRVAREKPRRAVWHRQLALTHDGGGLVGDRHAVCTALFRHHRWLRPAQMFKVELFEPRLPHLAQPRTGQHAHADDIGGTPVLGCIQSSGKACDFLPGQEPLPGRLDAAVKALGRVVFAPAPFDRQREHLAQHLAHPVGAHRCWLCRLQLARPVVGFFLVRPRPPLGHLVQQLVDVSRGDFRHQLPTPDRGHQLGQRGALVGGVTFRQLGQMLGAVALDQIVDTRRFAQGPALG